MHEIHSKKCLIINNLHIGFQAHLLDDVLLFFKTALQIEPGRADLAACHPLGPIKDGNNTQGVVIKLIYHHIKDRVWARKSLLKHFKNPRNRQPVYISEGLGKCDRDLKKQAEKLRLFVTTSNSTLYLHF